MGSTEEYARWDATELAQRIRNRELSAEEALTAARQRAAELNPRLNAILRELPETAAGLLRRLPADAPFAGVPFLLKDLIASLEGTVMASGCGALRDEVSTHTHAYVQRCLDAGLVVFGKTNTPEFGLMGTTEPRAFGPTRNPWDLTRTAGGSSGGSAAAVAAGIVPMALGGDGGGSIRIPASCCGLFGFKPSRGLSPVGPDFSEIWEGAAVQHVLTRSVRDSAAMLDATCGPEPGDAWPVPSPTRRFVDACQVDPPPLRVAFSTRSPLGGEVAGACRRAVTDTARLLEGLGHHVEEAEPEVDGHAVAHAFLSLYASQMAADVAELSEHLAVPLSRLEIEAPTRALAALGRAMSSGEYVRTRRRWNQFGRAMGRFHARHDVYLTPTLADLPQPIDTLYPSSFEQRMMRLSELPGVAKAALRRGMLEKMATPMLGKMPFTQLANLTGQPAMSWPSTPHDGLPVGVQFVAPIGEDARLFALAGQLERAAPPRHLV